MCAVIHALNEWMHEHWTYVYSDSIFATPIINFPEVGILGIHRIAARPIVRDGRIVAREMGNVSVTFDHRVVDGARAAAFCLAVIDRLQGSP
jgi:pyruvate dehydrogenase E2 component (dihydrolipoamide acetyltransferase)